MKLVIQIPCYNEEECLHITLKEIPESFPGIDEFEILIIDDGSTDKTIEIARNLGIKNFVKNGRNLGLAKAFSKGLSKCLELNADIVVNLDGDNQYRAKDIEKLITPIIENKVDIVIGARPIKNIKYFSFARKLVQKFGSFLVKLVSNQNILDATSGFRAFSREAAFEGLFIRDWDGTWIDRLENDLKREDILYIFINSIEFNKLSENYYKNITLKNHNLDIIRKDIGILVKNMVNNSA